MSTATLAPPPSALAAAREADGLLERMRLLALEATDALAHDRHDRLDALLRERERLMARLDPLLGIVRLPRRREPREARLARLRVTQALRGVQAADEALQRDLAAHHERIALELLRAGAGMGREPGAYAARAAAPGARLDVRR